MATIQKVTKYTYSKNVKDPTPVLADKFNPAVDQINTNTTAIAAIVAKDGSFTTTSLTTAGVTVATSAATVAGVTSSNKIVATITGGTNTTVYPSLISAVATTNTITFTFRNNHATDALNGTLIFAYHII
jgi:hypothetical protein